MEFSFELGKYIIDSRWWDDAALQIVRCNIDKHQITQFAYNSFYRNGQQQQRQQQ